MMTPFEEKVHADISVPIHPHPDNKPWTKCCRFNEHVEPRMKIDGPQCKEDDRNCQCFCRKNDYGKSRKDIFMEAHHSEFHRLLKEGGRCYCCHRTTPDGYHRECAGWAAIRRGKNATKTKV